MKKDLRNRARVAVLAVLAGALCAAPARADDDDLPKMRAMADALKLLSLEDATAKALAAKPGTVVEVDLDRRFLGRQYDYEFEIIDVEGQSWEVNIDARDGSVRSMRREWFD